MVVIADDLHTLFKEEAMATNAVLVEAFFHHRLKTETYGPHVLNDLP